MKATEEILEIKEKVGRHYVERKGVSGPAHFEACDIKECWLEPHKYRFQD